MLKIAGDCAARQLELVFLFQINKFRLIFIFFILKKGEHYNVIFPPLIKKKNPPTRRGF
jgi:hypothetical protein